MNYDQHLANQAEEYYQTSDNMFTTYSIEIFDTVSTFLFVEDLDRDELQEVLDSNNLVIKDISDEYTNLCECNGVMVEIIPTTTDYDPTDI